jgi:hypothetical protein
MTRASDDTMAHRFEKDDWLGVARCRRPKNGRNVRFVNARGTMVQGRQIPAKKNGSLSAR